MAESVAIIDRSHINANVMLQVMTGICSDIRPTLVAIKLISVWMLTKTNPFLFENIYSHLMGSNENF